MTDAEIDKRCTTRGSPCEGSLRAVHPVILVAIHQETLLDGVQ